MRFSLAKLSSIAQSKVWMMTIIDLWSQLRVKQYSNCGVSSYWFSNIKGLFVHSESKRTRAGGKKNHKLHTLVAKVWIFKEVISLQMNFWSVELFLNFPFIKIRFSCNQNIGETLFHIEWVSLQCFDYRRIILKEITSLKIHTLAVVSWRFFMELS